MLKTQTADKCLCERQSDAQKAEGTSCAYRPEGIAIADRLPLQASVAARGGSLPVRSEIVSRPGPGRTNRRSDGLLLGKPGERWAINPSSSLLRRLSRIGAGVPDWNPVRSGPARVLPFRGDRLNRQWGNTVASFGKQATSLAERRCGEPRIPPSLHKSLASSIW
jgi:hypothetical protein